MADPDSGVWGYCYDALGQLVAQQNSKMRGSDTPGACPAAPNNGAVAAGTPAVANAMAGWTTMAYDALGRVASRVEPEYASTWSYDTNAAGASCGKSVGKLCEVNSSNGVNRKTVYDGLGRPINSRTTVANGPSFASAVGYDNVNGRAVSQTYPTGLQVLYNYTTKGYLSTLTMGTTATVTPMPANAGGTPVAGTTLSAGALLWQANAYNAWGKAERYQYGNAVVSNAVFDASTGRVTNLTAGASGSVNVLNQSFVWNSINQITQRKDANGDGNTGAVSDSFGYDPLGRLSTYSVSAPAIPNLGRTVTLQYNALGMTLYKSDVGDYVYGAQATPGVRPHALQSVIGAVTTSYGYDANGNLTSADAGKYSAISYTSFNMPDANIGAQGPAGTPKYTWQYDENHQRIKEIEVSAAGTRTTWDLHPDSQGGLGFESESSTASPTPMNRHFLSVGGASIGVLVSSGALPTLGATQTAPTVLGSVTLVKVEYWHKDHLGSLITTTDHQGNVTQRYAYDPFGKRRYTNGSYDPFGNVVVDWTTNTNSGTARGYTGHEHLDDIGIIHMNGRIFDPTLGRFLQGDPLIQNPLNLQNYNRYGYCYNNPLTCSDPSGFGFNPLGWLKALDPIGYRIHQAAARTQWGYTAMSIAIGIGSYWCGPAYFVCVGGGTASLASLAGYSNSEQLRMGFIAGATAYAMQGVGDAWGGTGQSDKFFNTLGHAAVGCASVAASGGSCQSGAISGGISAAWGNYGPGYEGGTDPSGWQIVQNSMTSAMVGGISSMAAGGSFQNGAVTGAFGYLFNELLHSEPGAMARAGYDGGGLKVSEEAYRTWGSYLPGTDAGDSAAQYWADMQVRTGNPLYAVPGVFASLWTPNTAADTAFTLATAGGGGAFMEAAGPLKQWLRLGPSYSRAGAFDVDMSIRWGASPAGGGKYIQQIPSRILQDVNQWLRAQQVPFGGWRAADPGHFHLW